MPKKAKWSEDEIELLKSKYGTMPLKELQAACFPDRSVQTIAQRASVMGLTRRSNPWTADEIRILQEHWGVTQKEKLQLMLPGRDWIACKNQIAKLKKLGQWHGESRKNYAAIEPTERKRRSEQYANGLKSRMGFTDGTNVISFMNDRVAKNNRSGVRGVSRTKTGKFVAYVRFKGKLKSLGTYDTVEAAARAREEAMAVLLPEIEAMARDVGLAGAEADPD